MTKKTRLIWVVIDNKEEINGKIVFEIIGVFSSQKKAISACTKRNHGYGPLRINDSMHKDAQSWPWFVYPNIPDYEIIKQPQKCTCSGDDMPCHYCRDWENRKDKGGKI